MCIDAATHPGRKRLGNSTSVKISRILISQLHDPEFPEATLLDSFFGKNMLFSLPSDTELKVKSSLKKIV